jgi:exodeoxyribonuclease VII large subunit
MIITVSELNNCIAEILKDNFKSSVTITGEITNLKIRGNHTYFTLKDKSCSIDICFFGKRLDNEDGDQVNIYGEVNYYEKASRLNFVGKRIEKIGEGDFKKEYDKLFKKFKDKGYFENRKDLPNKIKNIGLITSNDGAALQDFLHVLRENNYSGNIFVYDCKVQGPNCPSDVVKGIDFFNNGFVSSKNDEVVNVNVDLIILMRGGGSEDDLRGFSDKNVVKKMYKSKTYIISAIGHEVDWMLSDYVANMRCATPSIAGEVISQNTPNKKIESVSNSFSKILNNERKNLYEIQTKLLNFKNKIVNPKEDIIKKLNNYNYRLKGEYNKIYKFKTKMELFKNKLLENNPKKILENNFILLLNKKGNIISDIAKYHNKKIKLIDRFGEKDVVIKIK